MYDKFRSAAKKLPLGPEPQYRGENRFDPNTTPTPGLSYRFVDRFNRQGVVLKLPKEEIIILHERNTEGEEHIIGEVSGEYSHYKTPLMGVLRESSDLGGATTKALIEGCADTRVSILDLL